MPPHKVNSRHHRSQNLLRFSSEETLAGNHREREERRMEGKRAAAATLYCMFIMLSVLGQQQQVAGFCGCFRDCYHDCREGHRHPGWFCTLECVETCAAAVSDEVHGATVGTAAGCSKICLTTSICGVAQTTDACVVDCTENWNPYKNKHT
ncbi:hypothetical protein BDA96_04G016700 [Sorghum bicolor]|uniref:Uncharacterized protein n=1 Tax=Sorghum bicolor TaxID=4558 RepID=A0A921UGX7_SORBI|nr:hypothetical protein BDA96_04G016700 [Sorghum bicolor]